MDSNRGRAARLSLIIGHRSRQEPAIASRIIWAVVFALLFLLLVLRVAFVGHSRIPQNGMYPSFPSGTYVLTLKRPYRSAAAVRRGDVVAFLHRIDGAEYKYMWRVVGLPGEMIEVKDGRVLVNGVPASYTKSPSNPAVEQEAVGATRYSIAFLPATTQIPVVSVQLPPDTFFMMGDNRNMRPIVACTAPFHFATS